MPFGITSYIKERLPHLKIMPPPIDISTDSLKDRCEHNTDFSSKAKYPLELSRFLAAGLTYDITGSAESGVACYFGIPLVMYIAYESLNLLTDYLNYESVADLLEKSKE
ncbi:MAG: hypothetical protein U9P44_01335 [archaeon]|nr:hypothetical protein [archaeon]